ncbi:MAG: NAD-dependent DNA ligase LigA [Azonexus sp.]
MNFDHLNHYTVLDARSRAAELRKQIHAHNHAYYVLASPTVTDAEYDRMFADLRELEKRWPQIADPNSPTARVGSQVMSTFSKTKHAKKMLSLDNAYSAQEVADFFSAGEELIEEPKFDGCSLSLRYVKGHLVSAVTRGDGTTGDDVTQNAKTIKSIPLQLAYPVTCEVRGEVYMPIPAFETINAELAAAGEDLFANPRNAAAGTLKNKDSRIVAKRHLAFVAYNVVSPNEFVSELELHFGKPNNMLRKHGAVIGGLEFLSFITPMSCYTMNGGKVDLTRTVLSNDVQGIERILLEMDALRQTLTVQTDGLVFKINSLTAQDELGDGTRAPKWATAYKYPPERRVTRLKAVEVSIGRLGTLTPVAILEPVQLSGTTVQRASLCNQDEVTRLGIAVGDDVFVEKSAEIIPKVMGVARKNTSFTWQMPVNCPCCKTPVVRIEGQVAYRCPNKLTCSDQAVERLKHTLGKSALDWDGFGDEMIVTAVGAGLTTLTGLLKIGDKVIDSTFKKAFAKKFKAERARILGPDMPLWRKIHSLGVQGIGRSLSQDLCAKWSSLADMAANPDEVKKIVGEVFGTNFLNYLVENVDDLEELEALGFQFSETADRTGPLTGKTFCITGGLVSGKREEVAARIEKAGGTFKSSVSKKVEYLLVGEGGGANKAEAAAKHGTKVITEEQLYEMMGVPMPKAAANPLSDRGEL